jgi:hypothetical protein
MERCSMEPVDALRRLQKLFPAPHRCSREYPLGGRCGALIFKEGREKFCSLRCENAYRAQQRRLEKIGGFSLTTSDSSLARRRMLLMSPDLCLARRWRFSSSGTSPEEVPDNSPEEEPDNSPEEEPGDLHDLQRFRRFQDEKHLVCSPSSIIFAAAPLVRHSLLPSYFIWC